MDNRGTPKSLIDAVHDDVALEDRVRDYLAQKMTAALLRGSSLEDFWFEVTGRRISRPDEHEEFLGVG